MILKILQHDWLAFKRSPMWGQSVAMYIFMGIMGLYFISVFFSLGYLSKELFDQFFPNESPKSVVFRYLIYYFFIDLMIRYMLQKFPSFKIKRYLTQNISRSTICHFLTTRSLVSFFNFAPFFLVLPVYSRSLSADMSRAEGTGFLILMLLLGFLAHYGSMYIDRLAGKDWMITLGVLMSISTVLILDHKEFFSLGELTAAVFPFICNHHWSLFILALMVGIMYYLNYRLLKNHAYLDDGRLQKETKSASSKSYAFFDYFGEDVGRIMELDLKLVLRNKRTKSFVYASILFFFYPFIIGSEDFGFNSYPFLILMALFVVGMLCLNFGQIMFSMNSGHFDLLMTQNIKFKDYLTAKFTFLFLCNSVMYFLSLPYAYFSMKVVLVNAMMSLFLSGAILFVYMFLGLSNSKKFEINSGGMFNMQGFSAAHFMIMVPILVVPLLVYALFRAFDQRVMGVICLGIIGLMGIIGRNYLLSKAEDSLKKNKYSMSLNYKK